jgi:signal transduction histidine kinase/CheY-like chemotaxis protein
MKIRTFYIATPFYSFFGSTTKPGIDMKPNRPQTAREEALSKRIEELRAENLKLASEIARLNIDDLRLSLVENRYADLVKLFPQESYPKDKDSSSVNLNEFEFKLRHAQRMEAVGTLAGGIAHDFNNILTAIIASASLIQRGLDPGSPLRRHLDRIFSAAERATALTQSILAYSRRQPSTPTPVKLNIIVANLQKLLSKLVPENIAFSVSFADRELPFMADVGQIEHIIMNLVSNAIDAMPDGGKLAICTAHCDPDSGDLPDYILPAEYAVLKIIDTGTGMDSMTRESLFHPFFTTKEVGKGTGLGLAMTYGIVKQHNGYIDVQSEPGKGSTFSVYFPLLHDSVKGTETGIVQSYSGNNETMLLIEDDPDVRNMLKEMLESYGYRVREATDGEEGVTIFSSENENIKLILSDVMLPGKNGMEAYAEMKRIRDDIRVIFISGYSRAATNEILGEGTDFLAKPVSPRELLIKIKEALTK